MGMNKSEIIECLQKAHNKYFSLLIENYPGFQKDDALAEFGPPELCTLAIEVQSAAISLGPKVLARLNHIGLSELYPFDNPIDLYNWRNYVTNNSIDHTTYASIAIRIDEELKRLRRVIEIGGIAHYESVPDDLFLVSKSRYSEITTEEQTPNKASSETHNIHIAAVNIGSPVDAPAVNRLEELEKKTSVWSNISNVVSALRSLFTG